jgi:hypothetical protein
LKEDSGRVWNVQVRRKSSGGIAGEFRSPRRIRDSFY